MNKFLVCRKDAIKTNGGTSTIQSSCFPILVECPYHTDSEGIVRMAMDSINQGYVGLHEYVVVPMRDAQIVTFRKPQPQYEVVVREF